MTDMVNGAVRAGEFLTGNMDWFSFATIVPVGQTNVTTPVVDLPGYQAYVTLGSWVNVTVVDGTGTAQTYSTLNSYLDAFYMQRNLNSLISTFAGRANPVAVSVKTLPTSINGTAINAHTSVYFGQAGYLNGTGTSVFGSAYTTGKTIYIVNLATEKTLLWSGTGDGTNANGYNILASNSIGGLDGLAVYDTQSAQVLADSTQSSTDPFATKNTVAPYVGSWETSNATNANTMAVVGFNLAGTLLV